MSELDRAALLERGLRQQKAGNYGAAIASYAAASPIPIRDLPTALRRPTVAAEMIAVSERLAAAWRQLEVSRAAVNGFLEATGRPAEGYLGFRELGPQAFRDLDLVLPIATAYLRRASQSPAPVGEVPAMLDVVEDVVRAGGEVPELDGLLSVQELVSIHPRVLDLLARSRARAGNVDAARAALVRALALAPCYGPAYRLLGELLQRQGAGAAAARCFALSLAMWNPGWWSILCPPGTRVRIPGVIVAGHEIFFWDDRFVAVRVSPVLARLRLLVPRHLRSFHRAAVRLSEYFTAWQRRFRWASDRPGQTAGAMVLALRRCLHLARTAAGHIGRWAVRVIRFVLARLRGARPGVELPSSAVWRRRLARWYAEVVMWTSGLARRQPIQSSDLIGVLELIERRRRGDSRAGVDQADHPSKFPPDEGQLVERPDQALPAAGER